MSTEKQKNDAAYLAGVMGQGRSVGASYLQIAGRIVQTDLPGLGYLDQKISITQEYAVRTAGFYDTETVMMDTLEDAERSSAQRPMFGRYAYKRNIVTINGEKFVADWQVVDMDRARHEEEMS